MDVNKLPADFIAKLCKQLQTNYKINITEAKVAELIRLGKLLVVYSPNFEPLDSSRVNMYAVVGMEEARKLAEGRTWNNADVVPWSAYVPNDDIYDR